MERVHADGVAARLDLARAAGGLEDAKLRLELDGVAAEGLEGVADGLLVEASLDRGEDPRASAATSSPAASRVLLLVRLSPFRSS